MRTTLRIPRVLVDYTDGDDCLRIEGTTVAELLGRLAQSHPRLYACLCDETGSVRKHIHLFVNNSLVTSDQFDRRLEPVDTVHVFQAVSGG